MATLFSYTVDSDTGFAPNPFHGVCTLACCKPVIRRKAKKGDYVIGHAGKGDGYRIIYAMKVTDKKTFNQYWNDENFRIKRPDMSAGGKKALGDNIYHWDDGLQEYRQEHSCHSNPDGTENLKNKRHDTKGDDYWVLISTNFVYWGRQSPKAPGFHMDIVKHGPGHRCRFDSKTVETFIKWFDRQKKGRLGMPTTPLPDPMPKPAGAGKQRKKC